MCTLEYTFSFSQQSKSKSNEFIILFIEGKYSISIHFDCLITAYKRLLFILHDSAFNGFDNALLNVSKQLTKHINGGHLC